MLFKIFVCFSVMLNLFKSNFHECILVINWLTFSVRFIFKRFINKNVINISSTLFNYIAVKQSFNELAGTSVFNVFMLCL